MDIFSIPTPVLTAVGTAIAGIITAIGTYKAGKRKQLQDSIGQKHTIEQDAANALMELNAANKAFRDEIRTDLRTAQDRIAVLEVSIISKDKRILELEFEVQRLRSELERFQREKNGMVVQKTHKHDTT